MGAFGEFRLSLGGPTRRAHFLSRPSSTIPTPHPDPRHSFWEVTAQAQCGWLLPVGSAGGARLLASPCCCSSWGRLLEVTAEPQNDQLLFLCHTGHQKGIIALQTLVLLPLLGTPAVSHSPGVVWLAFITMTCRPSEGHGFSLSLCSVAPLRCG